MGLRGPKSRTGKSIVIGGAVLLVLIVGGVILLHHFWPFTEDAVKRELGEAASAKVSFRKFHDSYFPPGCVAEGAVFQRSASGTPFISIQRLTIRSNFFDLLHHHIARHVSAAALAQRYFTGRTDGLRPPENSEELLVAMT